MEYLIMELVLRLNYYLNLIFGIDIEKFVSWTCILILTQSQSGSK